MRPQLELIYDRLYKNYSVSDPYFLFLIPNRSLIVNIQTAIAVVERDQRDNFFQRNVIIRPDAKYFLLILFHQMIELPLSLEDNSSPVKNLLTLEDDINKDIVFLLNKGFEIKTDELVKEITAHTILSLMDDNWSQLNIAKFELWNKKS